MTTTIQTRLGAIQGIDKDGLQTFLGVPYAAPPVGDLRWRSPRPAPGWSGTLDATRFPNRCFQTPYAEVLGLGEISGAESEDCLYLNIYTPAADTARRPVLCWIHGGAFFQGSANEYDGSVVARDQDVVVVTINYRLGVFGFCDVSALGDDYIGSANRGFEDQIAALEWIRDNVSDYGGDPDCVTIWGESAGAGSVLALQGAPAAAGLFHRSIAFSGGDIGTAQPPDGAAILASHLQIEDNQQEKLLATSAEELLGLQISGAIQPTPFVDGTVITQPTLAAIAAKGANGPPLVIGCTRDEGSYLADMVSSDPNVLNMVQAMYANVINLSTPGDYLAFLEAHAGGAEPREKMARTWYDLFRSATLRNAQAATASGAGGWVYNFAVPTANPLGVTHGSDIPFTFNAFASSSPLFLFHEDTPANQQLARVWSASMAHFARTGDPNGAGLPEWPRYDAGARACLIFDDRPHVEGDPDGAAARSAYGLQDPDAH